MIRDIWLSRQVQKEVLNAGCKQCGYCLIGLEIKSVEAEELVLCPECGDRNILDNERISREDIDLAILPSFA